MRIVLAAVLTLLVFSPNSGQAGILDEFKTDIDEFTDVVAYYPDYYDNWEAYIKRSSDEDCFPMVQKFDEGEIACTLQVTTKSSDFIFADKVYFKCDESKFSIPIDMRQIRTASIEGYAMEGYLINCGYDSSKEYSPFFGDLSVENLNSMLNTKSLKIRVGGTKVIEPNELSLDELQNSIKLFLVLTGAVEDNETEIPSMDKTPPLRIPK